jgi:hypothetical protein
LESLKGRDYQKDPDTDWKIILKWILSKTGWRVWTEFIWLMIGTSGGLL